MPIFISIIVIVNFMAVYFANGLTNATTVQEEQFYSISNAVNVSIFNVIYQQLVVVFLKLENNKYEQDKNES